MNACPDKLPLETLKLNKTQSIFQIKSTFTFRSGRRPFLSTLFFSDHFLAAPPLFFPDCKNAIKAALVEHSFELGFDAKPFKLANEALHATRGCSLVLESLPCKMLHVLVFSTIHAIHVTEKLSLRCTITDSTASLLLVSSMRHVRDDANFHRARGRCRTSCDVHPHCFERHRSVGWFLSFQLRRVQFFRILAMF